MAELGAGLGETVRAVMRGTLDPLQDNPSVALDRLELTLDYSHSIEDTTSTGGSLGIAIGPAQISLSRTNDRRDVSSANLRVVASYVGRPVPALAEPKPDA